MYSTSPLRRRTLSLRSLRRRSEERDKSTTALRDQILDQYITHGEPCEINGVKSICDRHNGITQKSPVHINKVLRGSIHLEDSGNQEGRPKAFVHVESIPSVSNEEESLKETQLQDQSGCRDGQRNTKLLYPVDDNQEFSCAKSDGSGRNNETRSNKLETRQVSHKEITLLEPQGRAIVTSSISPDPQLREDGSSVQSARGKALRRNSKTSKSSRGSIKKRAAFARNVRDALRRMNSVRFVVKSRQESRREVLELQFPDNRTVQTRDEVSLAGSEVDLQANDIEPWQAVNPETSADQDRTWGKDELRFHMWSRVLPAITLSAANVGVAYSWNVFMQPLCRLFDNSQLEQWSVAVYMFISCLSTTVLLGFYAETLARQTERHLMRVFTTLAVLGLLIMSISTYFQQQGLLYFGLILWASTGSVASFKGLILSTTWFKACYGKPSLGSGVWGLATSGWAFLLTQLNSRVLKTYPLWATFLVLACIVFCMSVPAFVGFKMAPKLIEGARLLPNGEYIGNGYDYSREAIPWRQMVRTKSFWSFAVCYLLSMAPSWGIKILCARVLLDVYQTSMLSSGIFASAYLGSYSLGRAIASTLGDYVLPRFIYLTCNISLGLLFCCMPVAITRHLDVFSYGFMFCASGVFFAAVKGMAAPTLLSVWGSNINYTTAYALNNLLFLAAASLGPIMVYNMMSSSAIARASFSLDYSVYFYLCGAIQFIAAFASLYIRPHTYNTWSTKSLMSLGELM